MEIRNCKKCGRMFNYVAGSQICGSCREALEEKFQEVKQFVAENMTATISEISENCDVDTSQIRKWIREERLEFSSASPIGLPCENCGKSIRSGRFCDKCKAEMITRLNEVAPKKMQAEPAKKPDKQKARMHFLDN